MNTLFDVTISANKLNVRAGPQSTFDSLGFLSHSDNVAIAELDTSGSWGRIHASKALQGWISLKYVQFPEDRNLINTAASQIGVKEISGPGENNAHPKILQYLASVDDLSDIQASTDETAWCSCFVNWCVERAGLNGTNSATAIRWDDWQNAVTEEDVHAGDLAVFTRKSATVNGGHVGSFVRFNDDKSKVLLLGGNQRNAVRYSWYPTQGALGGFQYDLLSLRRSAD
jgi:uncharacterized protein (TIGR02594 family)